MKRAVGRGLLAVLIGGFLLESLIFIASGGIEAYITGYSTYRVLDIVFRVLISVGTFLCGITNEALGVSVWWLVAGLVLLPIVYYVGLLFLGVLGLGIPWRQSWVVLVPVLTTVAAIFPTLVVRSLRQQRTP